MARYYLGIDNGGTNTKASIFTSDGIEVATAVQTTAIYSSKPGFAEIDMVTMKSTVFSVIKDALWRSKILSSDIAGIAVCGHGKGLYLVNKDGKPSRNGILSADNRAWEYPEKWEKSGIANKVYKKTYQNIMASQPVCLLSWLKDNEKECLRDVEWIFECKDYIRFLLTGKAFAELTDYSGANLVNLNTKQYDKDLLELFGLGEFYENLPPLVSSTTLCGFITNHVSEITGLAEGTPVFGGMFDIDACAVAINVTTESNICMIAGTWSINEFLTRKPITNHQIAMNSIFCDPEYYLAEESSPTSAVNLEWAVKTLLPEFVTECKKNHENPYKKLDDSIAALPPNDSYPLYFPFIMASNVHPNAKACFIGLSYYHSRLHIIKSIYEGVAFSHRYHLEKLLDAKATKTPAIRLAGGVTSSSIWVQIFADVMGMPIEVVSVNETGTLGCAIAVSVAVGDYKSYSDAASAMVTVNRTVLPDLSLKKTYDRRYSVYSDLLKALDSSWEALYNLNDH